MKIRIAATLFFALFISTVFSQKPRIVKVFAGSSNSFLLKGDGTLWGAGQNEHGSLGDGSEKPRLKHVKVLDNVKKVAPGTSHTMVLKNDGTLWAAGNNQMGQLANGTKTSLKKFTKVMEGVADVAAGHYATMIIKNDGSLWAVGNNSDNGLLGLNEKVSTVYELRKVMDDVASISINNDGSYAIKKDNSLWAAGNNYNGALGLEKKEYIRVHQKAMDSVRTAVAGPDYAMVIKMDGSLWASGQNLHGQLGNKKGGYDEKNLKFEMVMDDSVANVACGADFSAVLKTDNTLWMAGHHYMGRVGSGFGTLGKLRKYFFKVLDNVVEVSSGQGYTMVIQSNGFLKASGSNFSGQFGNKKSEEDAVHFVLLQKPD